MPVNVIPVLKRTKQAAETNAKVLDHTAARLTRTSKAPSTPISKQILSTIFAALPSARNHVFLENDQENHFIYGLVLPLVARLLAVSTPGLLVVVQLPRPDIVPEWAAPVYDVYHSNISNGSKSAAPTTPSPQDTSRTPSPSDHTPAEKSLSPDHPRTEDLIRHADNVLSKAEAEKLPDRNRSPPPDSVVQDRAALSLICNGFEVLTGKMPPPAYDMGSFTLASVAWEKAGVLEPADPAKGVSMSFSNGMVTPTEGIIVTFSNGSLCLLTTRDPLADLDSLKISPETPVVVFSFAAVGCASVADLLAMKPDSLNPVAARVRENLHKPNFFFFEIGHGGALPTTIPDITSEPQPSSPIHQNGENGTLDAKNERNAANCPPILISSVPRAIPLFVNTINQTFIDPPSYEHANEYGSSVVNDRSPERSEASREQQERRPSSPAEHEKQSEQPTQPEDITDNREECTEGRDVAATSSAPETSKPTTVHALQSSRPLPPVHEVVGMSQGAPGGSAHHTPVYTYPYPPGNIYGSNPQSHHVLPHHVPLTQQGQSIGNPYYVAGHGDGHSGHAAQYQPRSYPNSYYHQHVVPGHENWHRVPSHYHGMPTHPFEARRDMPAQFAHRTEGGYGAPYYPTMQHGDMYRSQHMGVPDSRPMPVGHSVPYVPQGGFPDGPSTSAPGGEPALATNIQGSAPNGQGRQPMNGIVDGGQDREHAVALMMHLRSREADTRHEHISPPKRDTAHLRKNRRTETSSSTSTNSGGCTLVNGAVVGHSKPHQKRRKR